MGLAADILAVTIKAGLRPPAIWLAFIGLLATLGAMAAPVAALNSAWQVPTLITLSGWLAMAATQVDPEAYRRLIRYRPVLRNVYFARAVESRDAIAEGLQHLAIDSVRADVKEMVRRIDQEVLPELVQRIQRHQALASSVALAEDGRGPLASASPSNIGALRELEQKQRSALEGLLTRLSDINASLLGLSEEAFQAQLTEQTGEWAEELRAYWDATAEVFRQTSLEGPAAGDRPGAGGTPRGRGRRRRG